jgi:hypothetical protein
MNSYVAAWLLVTATQVSLTLHSEPLNTNQFVIVIIVVSLVKDVR